MLIRSRLLSLSALSIAVAAGAGRASAPVRRAAHPHARASSRSLRPTDSTGEGGFVHALATIDSHPIVVFRI